MLIEARKTEAVQVPTRIWGANVEYRNFDPRGVKIFIGLSHAYSFLKRLRITGKMPESGAALLIANHEHMFDGFFATEATIRQTERIPRALARDSLLDFSIKEDDKVTHRTGKKGDSLNKPKPSLIFQISSYLLNSVDSMPIHRGRPRRSQLNTVNEALQINKQVVGVFIQETRHPENDLLDAMDGPAYLARTNPDVPIYVVGVMGSRLSLNPKTWFERGRINVADKFTYREKVGDRKMSDHEFTHTILLPILASLLDKKYKRHYVDSLAA